MHYRMASGLMIAAAALIAVPAAAGDTIPAKTSGTDPNERICQNITLTGSRLATKRFCGTRAEWAERRRQDRDVIEQVQKGRHCQSQGGAQC